MLIRNWWLLALCGIADAAISVIFLTMQRTGAAMTFHTWNSMIALLGKLALVAGACAIAAGVWRATKPKCWPLVVNGLALSAFGLIDYAFVRFPISFRTIALLIMVMAMSLGALGMLTAPGLRRHVADGWFLRSAGAAWAGFAFVFLALAFHWIEVDPESHSDLLWLGCYFGFSAVCMLALALRLNNLRGAIHRLAARALPAG